MRFCKRRFQFCQLLLRNNWKAVVKADLNYPAGNFGAIRKIRANRNVIIDHRTRRFSAGTHVRKKFRRWKKYWRKKGARNKKIYVDLFAKVSRSKRFADTFDVPTCVKVVLCRRRAGVGQLAVVGVWPIWGLEAQGSGFNFLKAPSAPEKRRNVTLTLLQNHLIKFAQLSVNLSVKPICQKKKLN